MNQLRARGLDEGPFRAAVLEAVSQIPAGKVASFDEIAEWIGYPPEAASLVGWVVTSSPAEVPSHRAVEVDGSLVIPDQADRLSQEGVEVLPGPRIEPARYSWKPDLRLRHHGPIVSSR